MRVLCIGGQCIMCVTVLCMCVCGGGGGAIPEI